MRLLLFIGLVALLLWFSCKVANEFREIAKKKGHFEEKYFWWTFWLPAVGIPMVIALPDRGNK